MTPKEEAKYLLKEFDIREKPLNDAGIFVNEMIYEWKFKHRPCTTRDSAIEFWMIVKEELELMFHDKQPYSEWL